MERIKENKGSARAALSFKNVLNRYKNIDKYTESVYNKDRSKERGENMSSKHKKGKHNRLENVLLATAILDLIIHLIELVEKLIE